MEAHDELRTEKSDPAWYPTDKPAEWSGYDAVMMTWQERVLSRLIDAAVPYVALYALLGIAVIVKVVFFS